MDHLSLTPARFRAAAAPDRVLPLPTRRSVVFRPPVMPGVCCVECAGFSFEGIPAILLLRFFAAIINQPPRGFEERAYCESNARSAARTVLPIPAIPS